MLWIILIGGAAAVIGGLAYRARTRPPDHGTVSAAWRAEQTYNKKDGHRD